MANVNDVAGRLEAVNLNNENLGHVPLAAKKQSLPAGRTPVQIATNFRKLTVEKNKPIFKYSVEINFYYKKADGTEHSKEKSNSVAKGPEHERNKDCCSLVYRKAAQKSPELQKGGPFYYDRQKCLYSLTRLKNDTLSVTVTGQDISANPSFLRAEMKLTKVAESFQTTSNDVAKSINVCPAEADKTILEALSLIVSGTPLDDPNVLTLGNCVHYLYEYDPATIDIPVVGGEGLKVSAIGTSKSIKTLEGKDKTPTLYMATELKTTLFHPDNEELLNVLKAYRGFNENMKPNSAWSISVKNCVVGLSCYLNYGRFKDLGNERVMIKIKGFGLSASEQKFDQNGRLVTVLQYFKDKYGITLQYPRLFTILARGRDGQTQNIPVECLVLCPSQPVRTEQMSKDEQAKLIKLASAWPKDRQQRTNAVVATVGLGKDRQGFVKVSEPETVTGYVLDKPNIKFGGNQVKWNDPNKRGPATDFNITKFLRPAKLLNWKVVFDRNVPIDKAIMPLITTMKEMGMDVNQPGIIYIDNGNLRPVFIDAVKNKLQLLLFITKSNNNYHQEMKALEQEYDVITQDIRYETAERIPNQGNTRKNIVNKINIKLGGMNYEVVIDFIKQQQLIIGFETSQKGGNGSAPIAVGFAANISSHPTAFTGGYVYVQRSNDVYGPIIKTVIERCLREKRKNNGGAPLTNIIVYFSGVTEGQYALVNEVYSKQVKDACTAFDPANRPHLTLIAASKLHNTRLYKKDQRGVSNLEPGTIVDETIVNPVISEWYGSSAVARQGTNKAAKYAIVFNTDKATTLDKYQKLTNDLCYDHQIVYHPVSYPAPLYVAGSYSNRGAQLLAQRRDIDVNGEFDFEATNAALGVLDKKLFSTRYNA
ncbi:unnamed protein product [Caenorhabditis brenneri]